MQDQIINLLDSIYHNYPIGSILLWNSSERLKSTRNIAGFLTPERDPEYPINYVLDGQQRLSSIYAIFCSDRTPAENDDPYSPDISMFDISFDFKEEKFTPTNEIPEKHSSILLHSLFDMPKFFEAIHAFPPDLQKAAQGLYSRFTNYEVPIITIANRTKDEVGNIFERINSTGTKLTTLDLMIAWTWSEDFHLREKLSDILEMLEDKGFGELPERIFLQAISGIIQESTKTRMILSLDPAVVREMFDRMRKSIELVVDFLTTQLNISTLELLPHVQQIVPLAYFFSKIESPSSKQAKIAKEWFWKTSFSRRYSSQTDGKMDQDIQFFAGVASNSITTSKYYSYEIDASALRNLRISKGNPFARAFLLLLAQNKPLDLINGSRIDVGVALAKYNRKEYHHVFPRAYLKEKSYDIGEINSLCNICILPSGSNKRIGRTPPSEYIFDMIDGDKRKEILESNLFPLKMDVYSANDYEEFLNLRSSLILQFLDSLIA